MSEFERLSLSINCAGEVLWLHPAHVMYWPARKTLFVADVHVGKEHRFGRSGIAIPGGISEQTLRDLFALCDQSGAERLMVLGDFMHAKPSAGESWLETLSVLLAERPALGIEIVAGNHDKPAGRSLLDGRVLWHADSIVEGAFVLVHEPVDDPRGYVLSGHLHPAWRLSTTRRGGVRAPVFWLRPGHAVLPAFGGFTGAARIEPDLRGDRLFMTGPDCVIEIPASAGLTKNRFVRKKHRQDV